MDETQNQIIMKHLLQLGSITSWIAIQEYRITRLAARIADLKRQGFTFWTEWETNESNGKRYKRYGLAQTDHNRHLLQVYGYRG